MEYAITSNSQHVTVVTYAPGFTRPSCASCDFNPVDGVWWINRVVVEPQRARKRGIGSALLRRLVEEVQRYGGLIRVTPGGYSLDTEGQIRFYEMNGFVRVEDLDDRYMEYRGIPDEK